MRRQTLAKILVVEDDPSLRTVIRLLLEPQGHEISEAGNGKAALEQLADRIPDVMLVDEKMPLLSGTELIRLVRADPRYTSIPTVLLTGFSDLARDRQDADAVIAKPFAKGQLFEVIGRMLSRRSG